MQKKLIVSLSLLSLMISQSIKADYSLYYPLKDKPLNFVVNGIDGSIKFDKSTIQRGETANLIWNYKYANKIDIENLGTYNSNTGSVPVSPIQSTAYNTIVHNGDKSKKETVYLKVIQPDPKIAFSADRNKIGEGESVNLSWTLENIDSASINNGIGSISNQSSVKVSPTQDQTYTLTAVGYFGEKSDSKSLTIDVIKNSIIEFLTVNKNKFTVGESAVFNWSVSDSERLELSPYGVVDKTTNTASIPLNSLGNFDYTLKSTSFNNSIQSSDVVKISVYGIPEITSFTVNNKKAVTVEAGDDLKFDWILKNSESAEFDGAAVTGNSSSIKAPATNKNYQLNIVNGAGKSVSDSVAVTVVTPVDISTFSSPSTVFANAAFLLNWTGSGASKYELSSTSGSGINSTIDVSEQTSNTVTPTATGNFTYTLKATNLAEKTVTKTTNVVVEADPTFTNLLVNGQSSITVSPSTALNFTTTGMSSGSSLKGKNSDGTSDMTLPTSANSTAGTTNYYGVVSKTLNEVTRNSSVRSVSVTVVDAPTIGVVTAPTSVFSNAAFNISWSGSNVINYTIRGNSAASGVPTSDVNLDTTTTTTVTPTAAGTYTYTITATNAANVKTTKTVTVTAEASPTFTGFTVNGQATINVAPSATLSFVGSGFSSGATLQGRNSAGTSNSTLPTTASGTAGTTTYYASAMKTINGITNYSATRSVSVTVVNAPTVASISNPTSVFEDSPFTISWSGTNATNYKIKSNNANSGISTSDVDLDTATTTSITPTAAGTYTYTITATNAAGVTATKTTSVTVESLPTFTGFTVNGSSTVTVAPSSALTFLGIGFSSGATLQGRNSAGTTNVTLPTTASATAGTTTYYASAMKTVNGVTNNSAVRSVSVVVVDSPAISSITAPTSVFADAAFTMSWSASNTINYKIKSNNASSGISTSDVDLGTATSIAITPTVAGTYTYTLTATNAAGVSTTSTKQVTVEGLPTFTGFTVNGSTTVNVAPSATLSFLGSGFSSGATLQGRNSAGTANATLPATANATAGTTVYYASSAKTLNGVTNYSAVRTVTVNVVSAPVISSITAPTPVFMNSPFTMSWSGTDVSSYSIKSNSTNSGISTTNIDLGTATSRAITPTAAGTYVYTLTATNSAGVSTTKTATVVVEGLPTFTGFTVNSSGSINVAPSATLTFTGTGYSSGAALQGRNSAGTTDATLPATASSTAGTTSYYASAVKTLNGVTNYSAVRSVSVTVVANPTVTITAPSTVFSGEAFTMSWVGTDAVNYKIKSNNAASGVATTDVDLLTATSRTITPTAAGTYIYTITVTNSAGVTATKNATVSVTNSYLKIVNPQASSGIYNVTNGQGGTFPAYVDMSMDGGYWLLIARWTNYPASAGDKSFNNVVVKGQNLATYTMDATNYPVVPSGYSNTSTRALFASGNATWVSRYGQWQSFNTFASGSTINSGGFSVSTPLGAKTLYAVVTGWASDGTTSAPMSSVFGLWTAYGNGGDCGGAGIVTPNRICAALSNGLQANHLDYTSVKSLYIKASN